MSLAQTQQPASMKSAPLTKVTRHPALRIRQAVRDNNVPLLARLQHKTDLRNTDRNRLTSLSWAAIDGSLEVFEWLLIDYGHDDQELSRDADNNTILHLLASIPSPPTLSPHTHLVSSSSFPLRGPTRSTAEQTAICLRMTHLYHAVFDFVLDWSNHSGKTALHVAAQAGNTQFINTVCEFGADVDLTDLQGNTPLHYASAWGHVETIKALLERGCQFAIRNVDGFTAADFAYSHTVKAALETTARDVFEENKRNRRKAEINASNAVFVSPPSAEGRLRSGSVETTQSNGSRLRQPLSNPVIRRESEPNSARPFVPPLRPEPAPSSRPMPTRSPSLPVPSSNHRSPPPMVPPLPGPPALGPAIPAGTGPPTSIPMRRANSAQTGSSTSSGDAKKVINRGTPI